MGTRTSSILSLLALSLIACEGDPPRLASGTIEGRAVFVGPLADAPVRLVRWHGGRPAGDVARGHTDPDGRFTMAGLRLESGSYRLLIDAAGAPWRQDDRSGRLPADLVLSATVDYTRHAEIGVAVTPLTTLVDAAADALTASDVPDPLGRARAGFEAHLGFDPVLTAVGDPLDDITAPATQHRLVIDALARLGDQLGVRAGLTEGTVPPAAVLQALLDDARGIDPPAHFDGIGRTGPVALRPDLPLDPDSLRHHLAAVIQHLVTLGGEWGSVSPQALTPLLRRLTCSASSLFPPCDPGAIDDMTPPLIDAIEPPPGTPLSGVVDLRIAAHDPDGSLARVDLQVVLDGRQEALSPLPGPGYIFRLDTDTVQGTDHLTVEVVAINGAGLETRRTARWPLPGRDTGDLLGVIHKGPAARVRVKAYDLTTPPQLLGSAVTDEAGAFTITIVGYAGPLRLVAGDDLAADPEAPSTFDDELHGATRWRSGRTLRALVPEFRSAAPPALPVIVTPFTDIALAHAEHAAAEGALLVGDYRAALGALGELLGIEGGADALLYSRPASQHTPALAFEDAERHALALGCFSAQADALARAQVPDEAGAFNALDLVALYRADVRADGQLDGHAGLVPAALDTEAGRVGLAPDPLRRQFVHACARWLDHPSNGTALDRSTVVRRLRALTQADDPLWFDPSQAPPAFDEAGPTLSAVAEARESGAVHTPDLPQPDAEPDPWKQTVVRGPITLWITAADPAGLAALTYTLEGVPNAEAILEADEPTDAVTQRRLALRIDTDALAERQHTLRVTGTDHLGNTREAAFVFSVDRTPPSLEVEVEGAGRVESAWYTARAEVSPLTAQLDDASPHTVEVRLDGRDRVDERRPGGGTELTHAIDFAGFDEGRFDLEVIVTDVVGNATRIGDTLVVDRTPPHIELVPSDCVDEAQLPASGDPEGVPTLALDDAGGTVRLWQTTWAMLGRGATCWATFHVDDADAAPARALAVDLTACLIDDAGACRPDTERHWQLLGDARRALPFLADPEDGIPIDALSDNPGTHRLGQLHVEVRDPAGNTALLDADPIYDLEVVPPTLEVEFIDDVPQEDLPEGMIRLESLTWDADPETSMARYLKGSNEPPSLHVRRVQIRNPHLIDVRAQLTVWNAQWSLRARREAVMIGAEAYQGLMAEIPECATDTVDLLGNEFTGQYVDAADCLLVPGPALRCEQCMATPEDQRYEFPLDTLEGAGDFSQAPRGHVDRRWDQTVPAQGMVMGDFALVDPVETDFEGRFEGVEHFVRGLVRAFDYRDTGGPFEVAVWWIGELVDAITVVSLAPSPGLRWEVGAVLNGRSDTPIRALPLQGRSNTNPFAQP